MQLKEDCFFVKSNPSDFVVYGYLHRNLSILLVYNKMNYSKANDNKVQERIEEHSNNKLLTAVLPWIIIINYLVYCNNMGKNCL